MAARFRIPDPPRLSSPAALVLAVALPTVAFGLATGAPGIFGRIPFTPFFLAVALSAWAGGFACGLVSVAASFGFGWTLVAGSTVGELAASAHLSAMAFCPFGIVVAAVGAAAREGFRERERTAETLRASEARERARAEEFEALMRAVPAVVLIARDPAALELTGSRAATELLRLPPGENPSKTSDRPPRHYRILHDGRELSPHELPTQRAARGETVDDIEVEVEFDDGTRRRLLGNAHPLFDEVGRPRGGISAFVDVTKLANAVRARDDFLAIASHELKTPLTALQLHVETLVRRRGEGDPQVERSGEAVRRQVARLTALVNTLLDVSRLNESRLRLHLEPVDLAAVVREVAGRFAVEAERVGSPIQIEGEGPIRGLWDRLRMEQVVTNLLSNAVKYGEGKPISVRVAGGTRTASLVVADRGIGIAPGEHERIFERFERGGAAQGYGGLGIGLWIARELVAAHGGSIGVESAAGAGAAFLVELPLERAEPPA
jgi:signal transduction histidine kinase